ncbi:MAG TPA: hypothetical protein P5218_02195, partial [Planctomycetota bacterium]|nr:hypothetical protein [Planctomycetota bacterium]
MARLRHVGILLLGLAPWVLGACALLPVTKNAALPAPLKPTPGPGVREVRNSEGQVTVREEYLVDEAGKVWRHGTEWTFWPDGTLKSERNFDHSEPVGEWKTYWPDGSLRSDYRIDPWQPTRMVYYHPGGAKASE